jgi:hypothetical protein
MRLNVNVNHLHIDIKKVIGYYTDIPNPTNLFKGNSSNENISLLIPNVSKLEQIDIVVDATHGPATLLNVFCNCKRAGLYLKDFTVVEKDSLLTIMYKVSENNVKLMYEDDPVVQYELPEKINTLVFEFQMTAY